MVKGASDDTNENKPPRKKVPDYLFKIVLGGGAYVGKTSLLRRYTQQEYQDSYIATIGIDFSIKEHETKDGKLVKIQAWDLAGQERFRNITLSYFRGAKGVMLIYDVTNRQTFERMPDELREVQSLASEDIVIVIVGNKADLNSKREITYEEGKEFADQNGLTFYETSARDNINVDEVFDHFVELLVQKYIETHTILDFSKKKVQAPAAKAEPKAKSKFCAIL